MEPDYAESVALVGIADDASSEIGIRLGRFPPQQFGTLWMNAFVGGEVYSVSDGHLDLGGIAGETAVDDDAVTFVVSGPGEARFESEARNTRRMRGRVHAKALTHETLRPPPGRGALAVTIDAEFTARHPCVRVRAGRMEVMGYVRAEVDAPAGRFELEVPGKWHEQVGRRPSFGAAFTYLNVQSGDVGLLATTRAVGAWGYLVEGEGITAVNGFAIDPIGNRERSFQVTLEDGRRIDGVAVVEVQASVPIEGRHRPGATVRARTDLGVLVGHLNDWDPGEES
ncbi:MAG: hypothetical protein P8Y95_12865 [Gammaproteobacteria bacterium]